MAVSASSISWCAACSISVEGAGFVISHPYLRIVKCDLCWLIASIGSHTNQSTTGSAIVDMNDALSIHKHVHTASLSYDRKQIRLVQPCLDGRTSTALQYVQRFPVKTIELV